MSQLPLFEYPLITYTELATFLRCPQEYKLRFIDEKKRVLPEGTDVRWGRLLHSTASEYLRLGVDERSVRFLVERLEGQAAAERLRDRSHRLSVFANSMGHLHDFFGQLEVYGVEVQFRTTLASFVLSGRADALVQGPSGPLLVEFKVRDYREFEPESEVDDYLQLVFYALGLRDTGLAPVEATYYFFSSGITAAVALSESLLNAGKARVIEIVDRIARTEEFNPRVNRLCPTCGHRQQCGAYTQGR